MTRFEVDNHTAAKGALDSQGLTYTSGDIAQVKLPHRAGELARAAARVGDANININYLYCGTEPGTNAALLIFGVADVGKAMPLLEAAAAARS